MGLSWGNSYLISLKTENEISKDNQNYRFRQQNLSIVEGHKVKVTSSLVFNLQWDEASPRMQMWAADSTKSIIYVWKIVKYYIAWFLNLQFIFLLLIAKNYEKTIKKDVLEAGAGVIQDFKTYTLAKSTESIYKVTESIHSEAGKY